MKRISRREAIFGMLLGMTSTVVFGRKNMTNNKKLKEKMPVLFIGHGSPMNAIEENDFTQTLNKLGEKLPIPKAILMISAHWETNGTWVTGMDNPKTIHDFHGFPKELFNFQYSAPGAPSFAKKVASKVPELNIEIDLEKWGLDHGTWSVLTHIFPKANVPVFQLSLDRTRSVEFHLEVGKKLSFLREQEIMIIGSGNIVHNLQEMNWSNKANPHDWAVEFDESVKEKLIKKDFDSLVTDVSNTKAGKLSVPSLEHYLPLLYIIGVSDSSDVLNFEYEGIQHSSMSMRSFGFYSQ